MAMASASLALPGTSTAIATPVPAPKSALLLRAAGSLVPLHARISSVPPSLRLTTRSPALLVTASASASAMDAPGSGDDDGEADNGDVTSTLECYIETEQLAMCLFLVTVELLVKERRRWEIQPWIALRCGGVVTGKNACWVAEVTLLDYGAGNVRSIRNAIHLLGFKIREVILFVRCVASCGIAWYIYWKCSGSLVNSWSRNSWNHLLDSRK